MFAFIFHNNYRLIRAKNLSSGNQHVLSHVKSLRTLHIIRHILGNKFNPVRNNLMLLLIWLLS